MFHRDHLLCREMVFLLIQYFSVPSGFVTYKQSNPIKLGFIRPNHVLSFQSLLSELYSNKKVAYTVMPCFLTSGKYLFGFVGIILLILSDSSCCSSQQTFFLSYISVKTEK
ncbi:hypothetical protein AMECASPLE_024164 [Ameca splendens]|uniref:Uncharacterized protein n=1 Tax=Ameca splendens TaxID=208324 RepID=A0ABV0ZZU7_9TELE